MIAFRALPRPSGGIAERMLAPVFRKAKIAGAHAHRFRRTLASQILARGGTMADVADVLGIGEHIARRHYAKRSACQERIATIMRALQGGEAGVAATAQAPAKKPAMIQ